MKIVVLAGGLSPERNVSLSSGAMVSEALREQGHQVALVDLFFGTEGVEGPAEALYDAPVPQAFKRIGRQAPDLAQVRAARRDRSPSSIGPGVLELCAGADVVYLALHGACGEDGRIQAALDLLGVPYTGSGCLASAIAMDKDLTKRLVADVVNTPGWKMVDVRAEDIDGLVASARLPLVVKPVASGSSIGVSIVHTPEELRSKWRFITGKFRGAVGGYFRAQFKIMGVVAVILLVGFFVLRIKYALLWAILISILDFLPFFGTGTALIPWAALKVLSGNYKFAVGLIIIYLVSQLVRQVIQPKIVGDTIGLNPLSTMVFMYIGYKIGGIIAMIIAVPIGLIVINLYEAGAFEDIIKDVKELAEGLNQYRKGE